MASPLPHCLAGCSARWPAAWVRRATGEGRQARPAAVPFCRPTSARPSGDFPQPGLAPRGSGA
eukprot:6059828-Alexandrium_andersonii.AAC.1